MARGPNYTVKYRRRRDGRTDYRKRLNLLKSGLDRMVVRVSNRYVLAQLVRYGDGGDTVLTSIKSNELSKYGWTYNASNIPASYLTGFLLGFKGKSKGVVKAILDIGMQTSIKGSRIYATIKGAVDAGLDVPHDEAILPDESRINGEHIALYNKKKFGNIKEDFNKVKQKIENDFKKTK